MSVLHLASCTNSEGYLSALQKTWEKSGLKLKNTPAKGSLSKYRAKVSSDFFKEIFENDLERFNPYRKALFGLYVYGIDGDHLDLPASSDVLEKGYRGHLYAKGKETHYPKMYTAQAVDLINGVVKRFSYSNKVSETELAREMVGHLEKNSVTVYDRLHGHYLTMLGHQQAGNYALVRVATGAKMHRQIRAFYLSPKRSSVVNLKPAINYSGEPLEITVRLIKIKNPRGKVMVFMTNLPATKFSDKQVGKLYLRRWEIEGSFRDLTSTLKMCQWHSTVSDPSVPLYM